MRKSTCLCGIAFLLIFPLKANAQKSDVFPGYSSQLMEARPSGFAFIHGWGGSYTYNVSEYFGLTADLSGNYGSVVNSRMNFHSYLFGPQLHFDLPRHFAPLVQTLFGESRESYQGIVTKKFSFSLGGGLDYRASQNIAIRLVQWNFITGNFTQSSAESRFSSGIVLRF